MRKAVKPIRRMSNLLVVYKRNWLNIESSVDRIINFLPAFWELPRVVPLCSARVMTEKHRHLTN